MTKLISHNRRKLIPHNKQKLISYTKEKECSNNLKNIVDNILDDNWLRRNIVGDTFKIDVEETDNAYIVYAELPGIQKDEVKVSINNERLTISVNKKENAEEEKKNYIYKERYFEPMSRNIYLVDPQLKGMKAKLADGILTVTIQKQEKPDNAVKIDIE